MGMIKNVADDGKMIFISTPKGPSNLFMQEYLGEWDDEEQKKLKLERQKAKEARDRAMYGLPIKDFVGF